MKTLKKLFAGITLILIVACLFLTELNSQTVVEFYNQNDNTFVLKLDDLGGNAEPAKVILVYDSNQIALETLALSQFPNSSLKNSIITRISSAGSSAGSGAIVEDFEESVVLENWMLDTFALKSELPGSVEDIEEEMELEDWMTTPGTWLD